MRVKLLLAALLLGASATSCGPSRAAPVKVVVLKFNETTRKYAPATVELTTVEDIVTLQGPVAKILGSAKIVVDPADPNLQPGVLGTDPEKARKSVVKDEGGAVKVQWIDRGGVLTPADFHSLNLATTYYNFEQAFGFFEKVGGLKQSDFGTPNVYYFGDVTFDGSTQAKDNAFFFSLVNGFLILPFDVLQQVPLSINLGVLGHEYTHRVFNYRVFDNALFPPVILNWSAGFAETPGLNLLKSLDEGLADTFGTGVTCAADLSTCNPEFIGLSLPPPHPDARRLDKPHCMTQALQTSMLSSTGGTFTGTASQYVVGTILGSSLWRAANDAAVVQKLTVGEARKQLYQGLYRSLAGGGTGTGIRELVAAAVNDQSQFRLDTTPTTKGVLDVFVEGMTDPLLKSSVCSAFMDRFGYSLADLKSCPATAKSYNDCPR